MLTMMGFVDAVESRVTTAIGDPEKAAAAMSRARSGGVFRKYLAVENTLRTDAEATRVAGVIQHHSDDGDDFLRGL